LSNPQAEYLGRSLIAMGAWECKWVGGVHGAVLRSALFPLQANPEV
jgi:hypothetical protein